jgi:hypothetical protein
MAFDPDDDILHQTLKTPCAALIDAAHVVDVTIHLFSLSGGAIELGRGDPAIRVKLLQLALLRHMP